MHTIDLQFQITGAIEDALIYANGVPVHRMRLQGMISGGFKGARIADPALLRIDFHLLGLNGAGYSISYSLHDNGTLRTDSNNPVPITGTIEQDGATIESITFQIQAL